MKKLKFANIAFKITVVLICAAVVLAALGALALIDLKLAKLLAAAAGILIAFNEFVIDFLCAEIKNHEVLKNRLKVYFYGVYSEIFNALLFIAIALSMVIKTFYSEWQYAKNFEDFDLYALFILSGFLFLRSWKNLREIKKNEALISAVLGHGKKA